jgi:hypothetical protein
MIIIIYQIYLMNCRFNSIEGFEGSAQSVGGVDDTNAINTLAQIAKNLMAGGVTVPGNMNIQGDLVFPNATTIKGAGRLHVGGEELLYLLNKAGVMIGKEWGGNGNLTVQGDVVVKGRNILAELDKLNSRWDGEKVKAAGGILIGNKWLLKDTGDYWLRIQNPEGTDYWGGLATHHLWSNLDQHLSKYPKLGQNVSFKPNPDSGRCFDFGSHGRTGCDNGWSIGQLIPR